MLIKRFLASMILGIFAFVTMQTQTIFAHSSCCGKVPSIAWHPHAPFIATAHGKKGVRIYQLDLHEHKAHLAKELDEEGDDTCSISWSPCGRFLVVGNFGTPNKVYPFSCKGCHLGDPILLEYGEHDATTCLAWCRSGKFLAVGNDGQPNKVYEFLGNCSHPFGPPILISPCSFRTSAIAWSCDCMQIAVGNCEGTSIVYDFMPGSTTMPFAVSSTFGCGGDCVKSLSWSLTCCLLAVGNKNSHNALLKNQLCCTNTSCASKLTPIATLGNGNSTHVVTWDFLGQVLFEGNWNAPSKLYKLPAGCCDPNKLTVCVLNDLTKITSAAWSPCGRFLAIGRDDQPTFIYEVNFTGSECELHNPIELPFAHPLKPFVGGKIFDCFCALLTNPHLTPHQFKSLLTMLINIEMKQGSSLMQILESLLCDCLGHDNSLSEHHKHALIEGLIAVLNDLKKTGSVSIEKQQKFQTLVQKTVKKKKSSI